MPGKNRNRIDVYGSAGQLVFRVNRTKADRLVNDGRAEWRIENGSRRLFLLPAKTDSSDASAAAVEGVALWCIVRERPGIKSAIAQVRAANHRLPNSL